MSLGSAWVWEGKRATVDSSRANPAPLVTVLFHWEALVAWPSFIYINILLKQDIYNHSTFLPLSCVRPGFLLPSVCDREDGKRELSRIWLYCCMLCFGLELAGPVEPGTSFCLECYRKGCAYLIVGKIACPNKKNSGSVSGSINC